MEKKCIPKFYRNIKKALFQFGIGTYILPVNNRKQLDVSRSERVCRICDEGVIGDDIHFLFECQKLEDLRIKYMALGDIIIPNVYNFVHMLQVNYLYLSWSPRLRTISSRLFMADML